MKKRMLALIAGLILALQSGVLPVYGETNPAEASQAPVIKSEAAALMDQKTGKLLYEKDSNKKMYPASITKILTAMLVWENLDLDETITVGREINLTEKDSSGSGLKIGEKLTAGDLIWAMMLPSGNDAAYTAAVAVARKKSGSTSIKISDAVNSFVELMNIRAKEIGCKGSNFTNPDGYPDKDHYSTAYDMALISREALKNDFFRQVVGTYAYTLQGDASDTGNVKGQSAWVNKNQMINRKSEYFYEYATGIKTGSTSAAGYCLAASAQKGDMTLVSIVLKEDREEARWQDSKALLEYGFNNFRYRELMKIGDAATKVIAVRKYFNDEIELNALVNQNYSDILSDSDYGNIKRTIEWDRALLKSNDGDDGVVRLYGPIKRGQVLGRISYSLNGEVLAESRLTADRDSKKGNLTDTVYTVLDFSLNHVYVLFAFCLLLLSVVIILVRVRFVGRRAA